MISIFNNNLTIQVFNFQFRFQRNRTSFKASQFLQLRRQKRDEIGFTQETTIKKWGRRKKGRNDLVLNFSIYQQDSIWPVEISIRQRGERWLEVWTGFAPETRTHGAKFDAARATNFSQSSLPSINHRDKPSQHRIHEF